MDTYAKETGATISLPLTKCQPAAANTEHQYVKSEILLPFWA